LEIHFSALRVAPDLILEHYVSANDTPIQKVPVLDRSPDFKFSLFPHGNIALQIVNYENPTFQVKIILNSKGIDRSHSLQEKGLNQVSNFGVSSILTKTIIVDVKLWKFENSSHTHFSGVNFINILCTIFLYESVLRSFSLATIWLCNFLAQKY